MKRRGGREPSERRREPLLPFEEVSCLLGEALLDHPAAQAVGEDRDGDQLRKVALRRAQCRVVAVVRADQLRLLGPAAWHDEGGGHGVGWGGEQARPRLPYMGGWAGAGARNA